MARPSFPRRSKENRFRVFLRRRSACRKSPAAPAFSARCLRNVCAQGRKLPARPAPEGSVCPVGTWARRDQSDPKVRRREASALWAVARSAKRPAGAPEGSVCPVGTWAEGPKRPGGVSKYKGCVRSARRTPIFAREQIQGLRAASAQNADICEGAKRAVGAASARCED